MPLTKFSEELLRYPMRKFSDHLQHPNNKHILFSGRFGMGKTYFLSKYFEASRQQSTLGGVKYFSLHLSPVNYSIANTEDIFSYIKYDVVTSLLSEGISLEDSDLDHIGKLALFLSQHKGRIFRKLLTMLPKVGGQIDKWLEALKQEKTLFGTESKSTGDKLVDFLEEHHCDPESIFEHDYLTGLIAAILSRIKADQNMECVLIIDDLDRIDPEHIFRILNVFAAHLDIASRNSNKLGFDKVILVCDIQNVRHIFHAKYGMDTDFNGYIDKFYSTGVFHFDNREIVESIAKKAFNYYSIVHRHEGEVTSLMRMISKSQDCTYALLLIFVRSGFVNLRSLATALSEPLLIDEQEPATFLFGDFNLRKASLGILVRMKVLKRILGSYDNVRRLLERVPDQYILWRQPELYEHCVQLLTFLTIDETKLEFRESYPAYPLNGRLLNYKLVNGKDDEVRFTVAHQGGDEHFSFTMTDFRILFGEFMSLLTRMDN